MATENRDVTALTFQVFHQGRWFFPWAFSVYDGDGNFVYGEQHIETRRAATKDAEDIVARLSDGRLRIGRAGGLIHV